MARTVEDAALLLSAIAGPDPRSPIAISEPGSLFARPLDRDFKKVRIAWSRNLGELPVDPSVTEVIDQERHVFESMGCRVEDVEPDFKDADEIFQVWRAWCFEVMFAKLLETCRIR
jgi:amidase